MAFEFDYEYIDGDRLSIIDWSVPHDKFLTVVCAPNAVRLTESIARDLANYLLRWADGTKE